MSEPFAKCSASIDAAIDGARRAETVQIIIIGAASAALFAGMYALSAANREASRASETPIARRGDGEFQDTVANANVYASIAALTIAPAVPTFIIDELYGYGAARRAFLAGAASMSRDLQTAQQNPSVQSDPLKHCNRTSLRLRLDQGSIQRAAER
jgi:hypothetical protein